MYSHSYQALPLIPQEEFLALHPEHTDDDENALMTARIEHERKERETLEQQRVELQKRKQKLIAENKKRRDDLANLDKDLEKFIDVSTVVLSVCLDGGTLTTHDRRRSLSRSFSIRWYEMAGEQDCINASLSVSALADMPDASYLKRHRVRFGCFWVCVT